MVSEIANMHNHCFEDDTEHMTSQSSANMFILDHIYSMQITSLIVFQQSQDSSRNQNTDS